MIYFKFRYICIFLIYELFLVSNLPQYITLYFYLCIHLFGTYIVCSWIPVEIMFILLTNIFNSSMLSIWFPINILWKNLIWFLKSLDIFLSKNDVVLRELFGGIIFGLLWFKYEEDYSLSSEVKYINNISEFFKRIWKGYNSCYSKYICS